MLSAIESICVYCGSRHGDSPAYADAARALGKAVAESGWRLVYGGARIGLMGELADAALAAGGEVLGVIPRSLIGSEVGHGGLTELQVVDDMHARKLAMSDAADAFVALPGGLGTLEELFEMMTWQQIGWHAKPIAILDVEEYYAPLVGLLRQAVAAGFLGDHQLQRLIVESQADALATRLKAMPDGF